MKTFMKFIRSRNGMFSAMGALLVLLLVIAFFTGSLDGLFGTAGLPRTPAKGFTCLPTCDGTDGRMFIVSGNQVASFGGNEVWIWVQVPSNAANFTLDIFDGDAGKDSTGASNTVVGNWDPGVVETTYTLYADQVQTGDTNTIVATWHSQDMNNDKWMSFTVNNVPEAKAPNGNYFYLLKAVRNQESSGWNAFKVRSSGFVSAGSSSLADATFGVIASWNGIPDLKYYYPKAAYINGVVDANNLGASPYSGDWNFKFFVPNKTTRFELWDGDFDRGTSVVEPPADTKDPNSPPKPEWATESTVNERAGGKGNPADNSKWPAFRRGDPVTYELTDPKGDPIYINQNPSGTEEWERFVVSTKQGDPDADLIASTIEPGFYNLSILGLDISNAIYLRGLVICDEDEGCGDTPWGGSCPRTIGYWKNNFKKVLASKPNGVQETTDSLNYGLKIVAKSSKIFRSGLISGTTVNVADLSGSPANPLTLKEGYTILMRGTGDKGVTYFSNLDRKTMLARALQQNLATWMNLGTGKLSGTAVVVIPLPGNPYEGSLLGALQEAEDLILSGIEKGDAGKADLERAKNIADYINNNQFTQDDGDTEPAIETNPDSLACTTFNDPTKGSVPSDKQPPAIKDMPKAPKHESPKEVPPAEPPVCTAGNTYTVENTTNNPFYSVKFNFASGTEIKDGSDTFKYTLPADVVKAMTSMQVEVKAATDARVYDLACDFTNPLGCGARVEDELYSVSFDGATENSDGTYTLAFTVYVKGEHGLSHVSFSLPEGQTAGGLDGGNYTTESCVAP